VAIAVADLCLFISFSKTSEAFQEAFKFCITASSYQRLMSVVENKNPITDTILDVVLDVLKENRTNYKQLLQQQREIQKQPKRGQSDHIYAIASYLLIYFYYFILGIITSLQKLTKF
jgi:hypothetical protein